MRLRFCESYGGLEANYIQLNESMSDLPSMARGYQEYWEEVPSADIMLWFLASISYPLSIPPAPCTVAAPKQQSPHSSFVSKGPIIIVVCVAWKKLVSKDQSMIQINFVPLDTLWALPLSHCQGKGVIFWSILTPPPWQFINRSQNKN